MKDLYRPKWHFTAERNWLNDPNGLVYYQGEYHLFFQHHPNGDTWGTMHWGHAVSRDLLHWERLPIALYPDELGTIFSGSAVVDWRDTTGFFDGGSGLVAIFTHHADSDAGVLERQSLAYSKDAGRTWTKYAGNPVLANERETDFRDPKVIWHEPSQSWIMVAAAGQRILFYASPNLIDWACRSEFGLPDAGNHDGVWECPDLFELPVQGEERTARWVLLVSVGSQGPEGARTQYFIGQFDGMAFANDHEPGQVLWLDHGRDNYAGVSWSDVPAADGRRIYTGWMSNPQYANRTPSVGWRGAMTVPRQLELRPTPEGIRLFQRPVRELASVWQQTQTWEACAVGPGASVAAAAEQAAFELVAELEWQDAADFGLKIRTGEYEQTVIGYQSGEGRLYIDRSRSGIVDFHAAFPCRHDAAVALRQNRLRLQLLVDRCSLELFAQDGQCAMTDLIFPTSLRREIEWFADGGTVRLLDFRLRT